MGKGIGRAALVLFAGWIVFFCALRAAQHFSFGTNANDLSIYDYALHSTLSGRVMVEPFHQYGFGRYERHDGLLAFVPGSVHGWQSYFELHFTPILFFFVPLYALFPGPLLLLYIQVLAVGLSGLFLFLIARSVFAERYVPWLVALAYLFFRQALIGLMHDFHPELLFAPLFLGACYFLVVRKKRLAAFVMLMLALLVKEDVGVYLFFFGLFAVFKLKERKFGGLTSAVALTYVLIVLAFIIPTFRHHSGDVGFYQYGSNYGQAGATIFKALGHILAHPGLLVHGTDFGAFLRVILPGMLLPLLFTPLASSYGLLVIPPLAVAVFSKIPQFYTFGIHYSSALLPFLFLAFIYGLKNVRDFLAARFPRRGPMVFKVLGAVLLAANLGNSNILRIIQPGRYQALSTYSDFRKLAALIPPGASVAAQSALVPHLPPRQAIDMLPGFHDDDFVLVHGGVNLWPYTRTEFDNLLAALDNGQLYELMGRRGEARLYRRK